MLPEGILVFVLISLSALIKWGSESLDHHLRVCLMVLWRPWQPAASHEACGAFIGRMQMALTYVTHTSIRSKCLPFYDPDLPGWIPFGWAERQCVINVLLVNALLMCCTQKNVVPGAVFITALQVVWSNRVPYVKTSLSSISTMSRGMC